MLSAEARIGRAKVAAARRSVFFIPVVKIRLFRPGISQGVVEFNSNSVPRAVLSPAVMEVVRSGIQREAWIPVMELERHLAAWHQTGSRKRERGVT